MVQRYSTNGGNKDPSTGPTHSSSTTCQSKWTIACCPSAPSSPPTLWNPSLFQIPWHHYPLPRSVTLPPSTSGPKWSPASSACFCRWFCACFVTVFQGTSQSLLISTFCTNFVFLHSKNFTFLHCLGLIDILSANQNAEIYVCILLNTIQYNTMQCNAM